MTLENSCVGEKMKVVEVDKTANLYQRFMDLGIVAGTKIECVLKSSFGKIKAYFIRGALIAIRDEDTSYIRVERDVTCNE